MYNYYAPLFLIASLVGLSGLLLIALLISTMFIAKLQKGRFHSSWNAKRLIEERSRADDNINSIMLICSLIALTGYWLFYSRNGAVQPWYTANLFIPILMLMFVISNYVAAILHNKTQIWFSMLFILAITLNIGNVYPISTVKAPWPHQTFMLDAGRYLAENKFDCRIGAWNAGIIGYYQGGNVINLDGLVNNDIYSYAVRNELPTYISQKDICYIVDFQNMLTSPMLRIKGGYNDANFITRLTPKILFSNEKHEWQYLTLYHVLK